MQRVDLIKDRLPRPTVRHSYEVAMLGASVFSPGARRNHHIALVAAVRLRQQRAHR